MPVLISDGAYKHTLAVLRSLGGRNIKTAVVDKSPLAQAFYSRHCDMRYIIPSSEKNPNGFLRSIVSLTKKQHFDVFLPIGWAANYYTSKHKKLIEGLTRAPVADFSAMRIAANKDMTFRHAESIGLHVPQSYYPKTRPDLDVIARNLEFPIVVKGSTSSGSVFYANNSDELRFAFELVKSSSPVIQEYVSGYGCGFFALYDHGRCVAQFMHKRLREFPVSGGPSVAAESYYSSSLRQQGKRLLDSLNWHGVAMVEFKRDQKDGKYKLMEINPKFWGSLELAISAGVDFPYLAYLMAKGEEFRPVYRYRKVAFRWPFPGDLLNALATRNICTFVGDFVSSRYVDDVRLDDIKPVIPQIIVTLNALRKQLSGR